MQTPSLITTPFAESGTKNTIPETGSLTDVLASMQYGFPPLTMQLVGGTPPDGRDLNGVLNLLFKMVQFIQAGGKYRYNADFATAIGGYPLGARVLAADNQSEWINIVANNTSDPDNGGTGWRLVSAVGVIGSIVLWNSANIPAYGVLCDGRSLNSTNYPELYTAWYGSYVANQTFRVPNFTNGYYPRGFGSGTQAIGARSGGQLPNITGGIGLEAAGTNIYGAFYRKGRVAGQNSVPGGQEDQDVGFDASRVSGIYKDSATTVETNNVAQNFIVIAR